MPDIRWGEIHRHFHCHSYGVGHEHEALELVMPALVVGNCLKCEVGNARREVVLLNNLDTRDIKGVYGCGGALVGLEEIVRAVGGHASEVVCHGPEGFVLSVAQEKRELALMDAIHIDLFVVQPGRADEGVRGEKPQSPLSQTRVGGELPVLREPAGERARMERMAKAVADVERRAL
jgi:hypothetical protein